MLMLLSSLIMIAVILSMLQEDSCKNILKRNINKTLHNYTRCCFSRFITPCTSESVVITCLLLNYNIN